MPYIGNTTSDFSIDTGNITNRAVTATKLSPSSVGSNGQVLSVDGSGNLQWSTDSNAPEGTSVLSTGESGTSKYLRVDGDGTCSWQSAVDTTKIPLTGGTFSGDVSFFGGATNVIIHYDASDNALEFWDGTKAYFGTDSADRLEIYHDSGTNYIKAPDGTIHLRADNFQLVSDDSSGRAIYLNNSGGHLELGFDGNHDAHFTGTGVTFLTDLTIPDKIIHSGDTDTAIRFPSADTFTVETAGTEKVRIDSNGRLLIGHNTSLDQHARVQAFTSSTDTFAGFKFGNNSAPNIIRLGKSRNASIGGNTVVQNNDEIGRLLFSGNNGTDYNDCAAIQCYSDGTPGSSDMPGRLIFSTTPDGSGSLQERLRIKADGQVWIGGASGVTGSFTNTTWNLSVTNSSGDSYALIAGTTGAALELRDTVTSESVVLAANGDCNLYSYKAGDSIKFHNTPSGGSVTERIAIASTGQITYSAASGDNQITSKRTNAAGSDGNYFFHLAARNSDDNVVGGLGFHRHSATDDSRFIVATRPSGGTSTERFRVTSAGHITVMTTNVVFGGIGILRINSGSTTGALNLDGGASNHGGEINLTGGSNGGRIQFRTGQGAGQQTEKMRLDENGKLGIGTTAPSQLLEIHSASSPCVLLKDTTNNVISYLFADDSNAYVGSATNHPLQFKINNGNVASFNTNGQFNIVSSTNSTSLSLNAGGNAGTLIFDRNGWIASNIRASDGGSNVAGGSGGGSKMQLNKEYIEFFTYPYTTNAGDAPTYTKRFQADTGGVTNFGSGNGNGAYHFTNTTANTNRHVEHSFGRIGGSNRGTTACIYVGENSNAQGEIIVVTSASNGSLSSGVSIANNAQSWSAYSDTRLKNKISDITNALSGIKQIDTWKYSLKSDETNEPKLGVTAQSIESVYPEVISKRTKITDPDDDTEYLQVAYTELIPVCIAAIKELSAEVDTLKTKVAALESA